MRYRDLTGYSVLRLTYEDNGSLKHAISEALLGGEFGPQGDLRVLHTIRGREIAGAPIVGRDGEVTFNHEIWPDAESFCEWAARNAQ